MSTRIATLLALSLLAAPALAQNGGRKLQASLTGAAEVPGPGDADGVGEATVTVNPGQREVCYTLAVSKIDLATAAHIHVGGAKVAGAVVVTLATPIEGKSKGCVTVTRDLALEILKSPANYYVNVHNAAFPAGAVRGQLAK